MNAPKSVISAIQHIASKSGSSRKLVAYLSGAIASVCLFGWLLWICAANFGLFGISSGESEHVSSSNDTAPGAKRTSALNAAKKVHIISLMFAEQARQLTNYPNLECLYCNHLQVTDRDLAKIDQLSKLRYLDVNFTQITGVTLAKLEDLPVLTWLWAESEHIDDKIIAQLSSKSLEHLSLNHTIVTSAGVNSVAANCANLLGIGLDSTEVDDRCLPALAQLPRIEFVNLSSTHVTDKGLLVFCRSNSLLAIKRAGSLVSEDVRKQLADKGIQLFDKQWKAEHPGCAYPGLDEESHIERFLSYPAGEVDIRAQ